MFAYCGKLDEALPETRRGFTVFGPSQQHTGGGAPLV